MKRLDTRDAAKRSQKRLVLNRETLRKLDGNDMAQVAGGATVAASCFPCNTTKRDDDVAEPAL